MDRPLTTRERDVLDALLTVEFDGVRALRDEATTARVVRRCGCGCPSIGFRDGIGMHVRVNAAVRDSHDGLFLYTLDGRLGGIEWVGVAGDDPVQLPRPTQLVITPA